MKKQDNLAKKIEDQARAFKLRTKRSPHDMKKHGGIQTDEADAMKAAHDKLDWPDAKIGRVFDRDPRTVRKKVSKPEKPAECQAPPDNVNDGILQSWGVPSNEALEIMMKWRFYHEEGKHEYCQFYADLKEDLITRKISFAGALRLLDAGIEAKERNNKKLLEAVDVARVIQPWKSTRHLNAYHAELRRRNKPGLEARQKRIKEIEDLLNQWRIVVNRGQSAKEYDDVFKIENDPLYESMMHYCVKVASAYSKLKIAFRQLQSMQVDDLQSSDIGKKKQILQQVESYSKELQKAINDTLKHKWYNDVWYSDFLPDNKK
jgi:hypothetical protein